MSRLFFIKKPTISCGLSFIFCSFLLSSNSILTTCTDSNFFSFHSNNYRIFNITIHITNRTCVVCSSLPRVVSGWFISRTLWTLIADNFLFSIIQCYMNWFRWVLRTAEYLFATETCVPCWIRYI